MKGVERIVLDNPPANSLEHPPSSTDFEAVEGD